MDEFEKDVFLNVFGVRSGEFIEVMREKVVEFEKWVY